MDKFTKQEAVSKLKSSYQELTQKVKGWFPGKKITHANFEETDRGKKKKRKNKCIILRKGM